MDLGDRFSRYCRLDGAGEVVEEGKVAMTEEALRGLFGRIGGSRVALETGTHSPWVSRVVSTCGHEVIVANPRKVRLIYESERKTDRVDAEAQARVARMDPRLLIRCGTASISSVAAHSPNSTCRFLWHDRHRHRLLHECASRNSSPHSGQRMRAKPWTCSFQGRRGRRIRSW